ASATQSAIREKTRARVAGGAQDPGPAPPRYEKTAVGLRPVNTMSAMGANSARDSTKRQREGISRPFNIAPSPDAILPSAWAFGCSIQPTDSSLLVVQVKSEAVFARPYSPRRRA